MLGARTRLPQHQRRRRLARRHQPGPQRVGVGDGGREPDAARLRRMRLATRVSASDSSTPRFEVTMRMQLVEDDGAQALQQMRGMRIGHQQRHLLRRGDQDVGRLLALALALGMRRVAGARLDGDGKPHLRERAPRGCARCPPPAPSAARCRACGCRRRDAAARDSSARLGRKPASVLPPPVGEISSTLSRACRMLQHGQLMRPRRPAARGKPVEEALRQTHGPAA